VHRSLVYSYSRWRWRLLWLLLRLRLRLLNGFSGKPYELSHP
jgi:hypothetical protein